MRVAILLSGHIRTFELTQDSFKKAFNNISPYIFTHFWETQGHNDPVWWSDCGDNNKHKIKNDILNTHLKNIEWKQKNSLFQIKKNLT